MLSLFMIGMVIDINPQPDDPPVQKMEVVADHSDFHAVDFDVIDVLEVNHAYRDNDLGTEFIAFSPIPDLADFSLIAIHQNNGEIQTSDGMKANGKNPNLGFMDKHYDPGSCASYIFI